jgi:hypothetical protein
MLTLGKDNQLNKKCLVWQRFFDPDFQQADPGLSAGREK